MTTLQNLIDLVRIESNMRNNNFYLDSDLAVFINASLAEMDDIMINTYEDYRVDTFQAALANGNFSIPVPSEMLKLRGVDIEGTGAIINGAPAWFPIRKFQLADRGRRNNLTSALTYPFGKVNLAYFWSGANGILIYPQTQARGTYQIWYVSKFQPLVNVSDSLYPPIDSQAWSEYAVVDACIKVLAGQDLDPSTFFARKEALRTRIIGSMSNRDAGGPDVVANVRNTDGWGGSGYGGNWGGMGGGF